MSAYDYNAKMFSLFIDKDSDFIPRYLEDKCKQNKYLSKYDDSRDYSFLWQREDYLKTMKELTQFLVEFYKKFRFWDYYVIFFNKNVHPQTDESILKRQDNFLSKEIVKEASNVEYIKLIFSAIAGMKDYGRKFKFYKLFLANNNNFNAFKKLPFYLSSETYSGSKVPKLQKKINFYEKIISECNSVSLLKHKSFLEQKIQWLRRDIQNEKRRDFTEEW